MAGGKSTSKSAGGKDFLKTKGKAAGDLPFHPGPGGITALPAWKNRIVPYLTSWKQGSHQPPSPSGSGRGPPHIFLPLRIPRSPAALSARSYEKARPGGPA